MLQNLGRRLGRLILGMLDNEEVQEVIIGLLKRAVRELLQEEENNGSSPEAEAGTG